MGHRSRIITRTTVACFLRSLSSQHDYTFHWSSSDVIARASHTAATTAQLGPAPTPMHEAWLSHHHPHDCRTLSFLSVLIACSSTSLHPARVDARTPRLPRLHRWRCSTTMSGRHQHHLPRLCGLPAPCERAAPCSCARSPTVFLFPSPSTSDRGLTPLPAVSTTAFVPIVFSDLDHPFLHAHTSVSSFLQVACGFVQITTAPPTTTSWRHKKRVEHHAVCS